MEINTERCVGTRDERRRGIESYTRGRVLFFYPIGLMSKSETACDSPFDTPRRGSKSKNAFKFDFCKYIKMNESF